MCSLTLRSPVPLTSAIPTVRGCETYVVREGYEGLVRGNAEYAEQNHAPSSPEAAGLGPIAPQEPDVTSFINSLRFGDGDLLRDGTGDYVGGRTLKGRYIVKVGWDDVRGWFAEVRLSCLTDKILTFAGRRAARSLGLPDQLHSEL